MLARKRVKIKISPLDTKLEKYRHYNGDIGYLLKESVETVTIAVSPNNMEDNIITIPKSNIEQVEPDFESILNTQLVTLVLLGYHDIESTNTNVSPGDVTQLCNAKSLDELISLLKTQGKTDADIAKIMTRALNIMKQTKLREMEKQINLQSLMQNAQQSSKWIKTVRI